MVAWYKKFIPNFADIAEPLYQLRCKDVPWSWTPTCQSAFDTLGFALTSDPILGFPAPDGQFSIHTDASNVGLGAILLQTQEGGQHTIAFGSRALTSATEKECLAVVWALEKWWPYIEGRHCRFVTDHQALCWLFRKSKQIGWLARCILRLQDFKFDVIYCRPSFLRSAIALALFSAPNIFQGEQNTALLKNIVSVLTLFC